MEKKNKKIIILVVVLLILVLFVSVFLLKKNSNEMAESQNNGENSSEDNSKVAENYNEEEDDKTISLTIGGEYQLYSGDVDDEDVTFVSDDVSIATVSDTGMIKGISEGSTLVKMSKKGETIEYQVTVSTTDVSEVTTSTSLTSKYNFDEIKSHYDTSRLSSTRARKSPRDSIRIITKNHRLTYNSYYSNVNEYKTIRNKMKSDVTTKYIFTAPHSVQQKREGSKTDGVYGIKAADMNTGVICELAAKETGGICISRFDYDATDPNYDADYSLFRNFVVNIAKEYGSVLLVDIHGIKNHVGYYDFTVGVGSTKTASGTITLPSSDRCSFEKKFATALLGRFSGSYGVMADPENKKVDGRVVAGCTYSGSGYYKLGVDPNENQFFGGKVIRDVYSRVRSSKPNFKAVQLEIANRYRTGDDWKNNVARVVKALKDFVSNY